MVVLGWNRHLGRRQWSRTQPSNLTHELRSVRWYLGCWHGNLMSIQVAPCLPHVRRPGLFSSFSFNCHAMNYLCRTPTGNNCDVSQTNNEGCGVKMSDSRSYGPSFNSNGGGWYVDAALSSGLALCLLRFAMERTPTFIKIWFWSRHTSDIPSDVQSGTSTVNTSNWVWFLACCVFVHDNIAIIRVALLRIFQVILVQSVESLDHIKFSSTVCWLLFEIVFRGLMLLLSQSRSVSYHPLFPFCQHKI